MALSCQRPSLSDATHAPTAAMLTFLRVDCSMEEDLRMLHATVGATTVLCI